MNPLLHLYRNSARRVSAANNTALPITYATSSKWVHNCWTTHVSGAAGYNGIEATFVNGIISSNSEQDSYYDFDLRAGVMVNGQFHRLTFDGNVDVTLAKEWGIATGRASVSIPPNTRFFITNRRVAADGGVAGTYNTLISTNGMTARQDGVIATTDSNDDFTMGVGIAYGAQCQQPPTINDTSGAVTAIAKDTANLGSGYSGGLNLAAWYGPAGKEQPASEAVGSGISGYGSSSGGQLSGVVVTSGGTAHHSSSPPEVFVGGTGLPTTGFGTNTAAYGPSLITGLTSRKAPSVLLIGDSIAAGYGSVDGDGDLNASHGYYEQILAGSAGVHKFAVGGESAAGWVSNHTEQLALIDHAISRGLRPSHVVIALGTNDFLTNLNTDVVTSVQGHVSTISNLFKARGAKVILTTIPPANTTSAGSNKFTTVVEQSPYNANYTLGSKVDEYNTDITGGTSGIVNDGFIDGSALMRDTTTTTAWRVDTYGGATAFCATDGIHPSPGVGIPYLKANLDLSGVIR